MDVRRFFNRSRLSDYDRELLDTIDSAVVERGAPADEGEALQQFSMLLAKARPQSGQAVQDLLEDCLIAYLAQDRGKPRWQLVGRPLLRTILSPQKRRLGWAALVLSLSLTVATSAWAVQAGLMPVHLRQREALAWSRCAKPSEFRRRHQHISHPTAL
jgi:hypothetical protein